MTDFVQKFTDFVKTFQTLTIHDIRMTDFLIYKTDLVHI